MDWAKDSRINIDVIRMEVYGGSRAVQSQQAIFNKLDKEGKSVYNSFFRNREVPCKYIELYSW